MSSTHVDAQAVISYLKSLHDRITTSIEDADGAQRFIRDAWTRADGGGAEAGALREGDVLEQAGINL